MTWAKKNLVAWNIVVTAPPIALLLQQSAIKGSFCITCTCSKGIMRTLKFTLTDGSRLKN